MDKYVKKQLGTILGFLILAFSFGVFFATGFMHIDIPNSMSFTLVVLSFIGGFLVGVSGISKRKKEEKSKIEWGD